MKTPEPHQVLGLILAGGLSRRMGGVDKAMVLLDGKPLVRHVTERLANQLGTIAINANGNPGRFESLGARVVADTIEGWQGPLAGILAGMEHASASLLEVSHVLSVPVDTPFFPHDLASRMCESALGKIAIAAHKGETHQAVALWPVALAKELRLFLESSAERKVMAFANAMGWNSVEFEDDSGGDPFFNINTPKDLAIAQYRTRAAS